MSLGAVHPLPAPSISISILLISRLLPTLVLHRPTPCLTGSQEGSICQALRLLTLLCQDPQLSCLFFPFFCPLTGQGIGWVYGKWQKPEVLVLTQSRVYSRCGGPRGEAQSKMRAGNGMSHASGLMLLHWESSHPCCTSCQSKVLTKIQI